MGKRIQFGGWELIKIYLRKADWKMETECYIVDELADGRRLVVEPMDMVFSEPEEDHVLEPSLRFSGYQSEEFLKGLSQALIELGYRDKSSEGELKATKVHLEDMRSLVLDTWRKGE
jgi:hypothetical protein